MRDFHDISFREQVLDWLHQDGEVICDVYQYGGYDFRVITSPEQLDELIKELASRKGKRRILDVYRNPPFPIRGIADATLEATALAHFSEGQHWLILCPIEGALEGQVNWSDEITHTALRFAFEEYQGRFVMIGLFIERNQYENTDRYTYTVIP